MVDILAVRRASVNGAASRCVIAGGPDGNMWFTERRHSVPPSGKIARITLSGEITEFPGRAGAPL